MGTYEDAIALAAITGGPAEMAPVRQYRSRPGLAFNLEQEITSDLGVFLRAGVADGNVEPYDYTDIDRTIAAGLSLTGKGGDAQTTPLALPASSTASRPRTWPLTMAASASWSAMEHYPIRSGADHRELL